MEYDAGDGKRQNVHSKRWSREINHAKIEKKDSNRIAEEQREEDYRRKWIGSCIENFKTSKNA